jgi:hypothetical protein
MKRAIISVALVAACTSFVDARAASSAFVACPLQQARTEITSNLPQGWWNTPQLGPLEDVRVETVGGKPTLMCGYWAYNTHVFVMRRVPQGISYCEPNGAGFICSGRSAALQKLSSTQSYSSQPGSSQKNDSKRRKSPDKVAITKRLLKKIFSK